MNKTDWRTARTLFFINMNKKHGLDNSEDECKPAENIWRMEGIYYYKM